MTTTIAAPTDGPSHASPSRPASVRKLRSSKVSTESDGMGVETLDDRGSATSKSEGSVTGSNFADVPLSPSLSSSSSSLSQPSGSYQDSAAPLRPAYLYLEGDDAEPPEEPVDDIKGVPVFTPTWEEFQDFYSYCSRIDEWGMRAGIVKIIPPKEWTDSLPRLDGRAVNPGHGNVAGERYTDANRLSQVRIKNSIEQIFTPAGTGVWRQSNVVHPSRVVNAKQWADICAQETQRGPEMKRMQEVAQRKDADEDEDGVRTRSGRGRGSAASASASTSKASSSSGVAKRMKKEARPSGSAVGSEEGNESTDSVVEETKIAGGGASKPKMAERTTQREWDEFDYIRDWCKEAGVDSDPNDWSMSTCRAIEQEYWRGLNYGKPPMYGADLAGTLFTSETQHWNIGRLDNILTRLRLKRKLPGVTTPYLYFGMWRATFAWHVEDMDLYSINYIHFGAPKQWYSIRQADKQRFELAMSAAFPADSSRCRHFMRHKSYLASPPFLRSAAGSVKPLRLVQKAQEIVITYPYGYHSGYNLGFNCAESVNFALERWLDIGRKAGYCDCTNDSVKMDVDAMLEESREMEELDRKREERERRREEEEFEQKTEEERAEIRRAKERERRKRKKEEHIAHMGENEGDDGVIKGAKGVKKAKTEQEFPCEFCVSMLKDDLVPIAPDGEHQTRRLVHRLCASFLPETWIAPNAKAGRNARAPKEFVMGTDGIPKARWSLKCQNCKELQMQKRGAKVQCTYGRCSRTSHVSCALQDENGWMLDVLPDAEADAIEGKADGKPVGKSKADNSTQSLLIKDETDQDGNEDDTPRMVVLCRTHNPAEREREARRKSMVVRQFLSGLEEGQMICIRTSSGVWETPFVRYEGPDKEEDTLDEGEVVLIDESRIKGGRVVIDTASWRKADDTVWYREEAKADRLEEEERQKQMEEAKKAKAGSNESKPSKEALQEERTAKDAARALEREQRLAVKEQKRIQRETAKVEKERKREEKRLSKAMKTKMPIDRSMLSTHAQQQSLPPFAAVHVPSDPQPCRVAQRDEMQYIRDWKPRERMSESTHAERWNALPSLHRQQMPFTTPNVYSQIGAGQHATMRPWHAQYGTLPDRRQAPAAAHSPYFHTHPVHPSYQHPHQRHPPPNYGFTAFTPDYSLHQIPSTYDDQSSNSLPPLRHHSPPHQRQNRVHHPLPHELISPRSTMHEDRFTN